MRETLGRFALLHLTQQFGQQFQPGRGHVAKLSPVQVVYGLIELFEEFQAIRGDTGLNDAPVVILPLAGDQTVFFHAIQEAGHVRVAGNHSIGDAAAEKTLRFCAAEDAQDVVLGRRKTGRLDEMLGSLRQGIGNFEESNEELVLERD